MTLPKAAIIIPHYNDPPRLAKCLDALAPQVTAAGDAVEVVVSDNNSTRDPRPTLAAYPWVRLVTETEPGAGPNRNRAVASSTAPWLFFIDGDCIPAGDWLATGLALVARAETGAETGVAADMYGGRVDTFDETPAPRSAAEAFETVYAFHQKHYVENRGFSVTANLVAARKVFDAVGGFRTGVPEDIDWCHRARAQGFTLVYADALLVFHPTRQDWPAMEKKMRRVVIERLGIFGTSPRQRLLWAARAFLVPGYALVQAPQALRYPGLSRRDRMAALGMLARITGRRMVWMWRQALGLSI